MRTSVVRHFDEDALGVIELMFEGSPPKSKAR
jgi:hypothetical protein